MPRVDKERLFVPPPISPPPSQANTPPAEIDLAPGRVREHQEVQRNQRLEEFFGAPVNFFGKVVDQNGNPVSGAKTFYNVSTASLSGSPALKGPDTNEYGAFEITGERGPSLSVSVDHPDFYKTGTSHQRFAYAHAGPTSEPPSILPSKSNPAIFVLQKKGEPTELIHHSRIVARLPIDGSSIMINLRTGTEGEGSEAIILSVRSEIDTLPLNEFHPFKWSVTIGVPGGGLIERTDALNFEAPLDGYAPQIEIAMPAALSGDRWSSSAQRDYFVRFASGQHGRIAINVSGEKGRCIAEAFLNPEPGNRNLEFDPAKAVNEP